MRIKGKEIKGRSRDFVVIPRLDGDIVLWVEALPNFEVFRKLCPVPKPPTKILKGGKQVVDIEDKEYLSQLHTYVDRQTAYMIVQSLNQPENELEWDTVDLEKPSTWLNYEKELRDAGFSFGEIKIIVDKCAEVNALSETKIEEARQSFARRLEAMETDTSGQTIAPASTKSGEPASGGE